MREEVLIVCFGMQRREKDAVVIVVAGAKERIKKAACKSSFFILMLVSALVRNSQFFLPLALLLARTALPLAVDILSLKPCLFLLFLLDG